MTNFIKYFARIQLLLGTLGSIYLSYIEGQITKYKRSWLVTIGTFTVSIFSVITLYILLYSMYTIISNHHLILNGLYNDSSDDRERKIRYWDTIKNINENKHSSIKLDEWRCENCGKIYINYIGNCACGSSKKTRA